MLSYVFMKVLEARPRSYDRRMDRASGGRVRAMKQAVVAAVAPGARVLEIGCGTGELAAMLCERGATVDGFDRSAAMLEIARQRIEANDWGGRLSVRDMGVESMDELPEGSYQAVVSTLVFSELSRDERRYALEHARRVLEPGGLLVIADEVVPRGAGRRWLQSLKRMPLVAVTYLASGSTTRPVPDLAAEIASVGFVVRREERSDGDAVALVVAHRPHTPEAA